MKHTDTIYFGGDYNPDQWDEATLHADMALFKKAGINLLTLPVFSWAKLEPEENVYTFDWLDRIIDTIWKNGIHVCLATPTAAQPVWLSVRYPEVLPVDISGRKRTHGMRNFFCASSLKYRERAASIAREMARRYARHPALAMWHVCNEYSTFCYCPACQAKFRTWLKDRYGSVKELNLRWHTSFWGRTLSTFEEVFLPTELNDDYRFNPAVQLDYLRFVTDNYVECFQNEYQVLKSYNPEIPVFTNMSGFIKKLDQSVLTRHLDMVGWDNYPNPSDPPYFVALKHDIMRGLKNGQSFILAEQSPNQQNWQPYNVLKRPGEVRRLSYQAMAHGADTCLFYQMRQSIAGQEKFHGAIISHSGREDTRVFRECSQLGAELTRIGSAFLQARTPAKVGLLFDWNNWWALELSSGPSRDMDYLKSVSLYYNSLYKQNIGVDVLMFDAPLDGYDLILAPMVYMMRGDLAERLHRFVERGGILVSTVMSGLADENDRCVFGEYPGPLKDLLGLWVEETDALPPDKRNTICLSEQAYLPQMQYACGFLCDLLHTQPDTETLACYGEDFYSGSPCVTRHKFGQGVAYYIATQPEQAFLNDLMKRICAERGIIPLYPADDGVELALRVSPQAETVFMINHTSKTACVDLGADHLTNLLDGRPLTGKIQLSGGDVMVAKRSRR